MASACIIHIGDILTDEAANDREAIALIRQIVAAAGVRVTEQNLNSADDFAIESFAPIQYETVIFKLVNRDTSLALRCISAFRKKFTPRTTLRKEAPQIVNLCVQRGWKLALTNRPGEKEATALERAGLMDQFAVKGTPPQMKVSLPDPRALEFLLGALGTSPSDALMLGTRIDNHVRPANMLRMTTLQLKMGRHGRNQLPRDLMDVPNYEAPNIQALLEVIPTVV